MSRHSPLAGRLLTIAALAVLAWPGSPRPACAGPINALVPAYFYPSGSGLTHWNQLDAAAKQIGVTAIADPANGPGTAADPNYTKAIDALRASGGKVVGYIATGYDVPGTPGYQTLASAEHQVDLWNQFYHINGIFIDQMSTGTAPLTSYYKPLYAYIVHTYPGERVFGNPGTPPPASYLAAANTLVIYENDDKKSPYSSFTPPSYVSKYPASRFASLVYDVPSATTMKNYVGLASQRNTGYFYVTNGILPNPYGTLPSYWSQEVSALASPPALSGLRPTPEPSTLATAGRPAGAGRGPVPLDPPPLSPPGAGRQGMTVSATFWNGIAIGAPSRPWLIGRATSVTVTGSPGLYWLAAVSRAIARVTSSSWLTGPRCMCASGRPAVKNEKLPA
jgi:hypothetical protein